MNKHNNKEFSGKIALVTGAGSGLGQAIAEKLFDLGAFVVMADKDEPSTRRVAQKLDPKTSRTAVFEVDVSKPKEIKDMIKTIVNTYGFLHYAVNNAGFTGERQVSTADYKIEEWKKVVDTNLSGIFYGLKYQIPIMVKQGEGSIVNMSSAAGIVAPPGEVAYVSSKHAIIGLTKAAAAEYGKKSVRINAVCPSYIETPDIIAMPDADKQKLIALHPLGRLGKPAEVAAIVCFLLSEQASFVTGSTYVVDGGFTTQ